MLKSTEHRTLSARSASSSPLVLAAALALAALPCTTGCAAVSSEQDADAKFLVAPMGNGSFFGWSEITIDQDPNSVDKATLQAVTVEVMDPPEVTDMTFIQSLLGEVVKDTTRTKGAEKTAMPKGERVVPLDILYKDDLRSLFKDHTIRLEWTGSTNPSFTGWPAGGIWVRAHMIVHVE